MEPYRHIPLRSDAPVCDAVRRKAPVLIGSPEDRRARYPNRAEGFPGYRAWAAVPLITHGEVIGAAGLSFTERRDFGEEDASHLQTIGLQAAQAIARARLFEGEHLARTSAEEMAAETMVLYRLSDVANRAITPEPVYEAALDAIRVVLGAERASVLIFDDAAVIRFHAWRGLSDDYRRAVEGHSPWTPTTLNPQPIVVPDVRNDDSLASYLPVFQKEGIRALAFIPLVYGDRVLGKFMMYAGEPRALDARQIGQARAIAAQVASAVGRAQDEEALRDANRRKDEFLAMLSHELRNPLAAARNAIHLLSNVPGDDAARGRWLDVVDRQTGNLVRLVDDLLDVSRITRRRIELKREPVDVRTVLQRAIVAAAAPLAAHRVTSSLGDEPLIVSGDPVRLEQVFANLVTNAGKYTPAGGEIEVAALRRGAEIVVSVRDNGMGIEPERLARVFDLFDQGGRDLARTQGGLGIGLTIVRGLVDLHGGRVEAKSDGPGRGSEFLVTLGASALTSIDAPSPGPPTQADRCCRVLVVDDHVDAGEMLGILLRSWGHTVEVVHDSAQVVGRAREFRPEIVLLDIGLPGLNGYDLARLLRADPIAKDALLIALTGYGQPADRERAFASGFSTHLVKPVQPDALRAALTEVRRRA
jgi:signal transduction histidine kinase